MEDFYIGQIFEGAYPPEAAIWCNSNGAMMVNLGNGSFQIQAYSVPIEQQIADIEMQHNQFQRALSERGMGVILSGGTAEQTKMAEIRVEFATLCASTEAKILALFA